MRVNAMKTLTVTLDAKGLTPYCVCCGFVDEVLSVYLPVSDEVRMYHYLCPNGMQEVVFK